jgi:hypothetical protein
MMHTGARLDEIIKFKDLEPVRTLPASCQISPGREPGKDTYKVYDESSLIKAGKRCISFKFNTEPRIVLADNFTIIHRDGSQDYFGRNTILTCHGNTSGEDWILDGTETDVVDIIKDIERQGVKLDVIGICNPAKYRLVGSEGKSEYFYPWGVGTISFEYDGELGLHVKMYEKHCKTIRKGGLVPRIWGRDLNKFKKRIEFRKVE